MSSLCILDLHLNRFHFVFLLSFWAVKICKWVMRRMDGVSVLSPFFDKFPWRMAMFFASFLSDKKHVVFFSNGNILIFFSLKSSNYQQGDFVQYLNDHLIWPTVCWDRKPRNGKEIEHTDRFYGCINILLALTWAIYSQPHLEFFTEDESMLQFEKINRNWSKYLWSNPTACENSCQTEWVVCFSVLPIYCCFTFLDHYLFFVFFLYFCVCMVSSPPACVYSS